MRKFKFEQINSTPYKGLDGTVIFGDGTEATHKILIEAVNGLGVPASSVQIQQAPFQIGASPIRSTFGPRTISLECAIIIDCKSEAGKAAMEAVKRDLGNKFSPAGMGYVPDTSLTGSNSSTVTGKLSYASDGVTYDRFIDCVPISCEFPQRAYSDGFQRFRLALFCPDPTWYDAEQTSDLGQIPNYVSPGDYGICFSPSLGRFAKVGTDLASWSHDGLVWNDVATPTGGWKSVAWSPSFGVFCAVALSGTGRVMTSPDGETWTLKTASAANGWVSICWAEYIDSFVAVAQTGTNRAMVSADGGETWQGVALASDTDTMTCVCSGNETRTMVAVSTDGARVQFSTTGFSWTTATPADTVPWNSVAFSRQLTLFCAVSSSGKIQTSPNGSAWTIRTAAATNDLEGIFWSDYLGKFIAVSVDGTNRIQTSVNGSAWVALAAPQNSTWWAVVSADSIGIVCAVSFGTNVQPIITYDGTNWYQPSSIDDYFISALNDGDVPAEFEIDIPVTGGETSKVIAIGDNFLWSGTGTPPSDHNLVFGTDGLKKGTVTVSTKFNAKDITQFGVSKFNLYQQGTFFSLYVSGATTNNIYVRNTGTSAGAPTIRWKNRYLGV